jgi:sugar phosphate permease
MFRARLTPEQRNIGEGIKAASARWGAALTPAMMAALFAILSWRQVFFLFGGARVIWVLVFWRCYRDNPVNDSSHSITMGVCGSRC